MRAIERRPLLPHPRTLQRQDGELIDFSQNQMALDPALLEPEALIAALGKSARALLLSGYQPAGLPEHRAAGAEWLARAGVEADPERVLVTSGGQQALAVALASFTKPGDTLLVEELTYAGMKSLAALFHLRLFPVAIDGEGLIPEALEEACRRGNPRLLYCMPNLHNPTGVVLAAERREQIAALAERYDLLVLEDDASGFLLEEPPPPIARLAPARGLFVSSLSKSLSPALRVGYLFAPESCRERLLQSQSALTWMTPVLMAEIAARVIRDGRLERIAAAKRAEIRRRRALFARALGHLPTPSHPASPCVWVALPDPWRGEEFAAQCERAGVLVNAGETFVVARANSPHAARICIGTPPARTEVQDGLARIARILGESPAPGRALV